MSSTFVEVFCTNKRIQKVSVAPSTKLFQIIEEVCQKQKLGTTDKFGLKSASSRAKPGASREAGHSAGLLDLSLPFRLSGLLPNAHLELVELDNSSSSSKAKDTAELTITVAIRSEEGGNLVSNFPPDTSLWDILQHWTQTGQLSLAEKWSLGLQPVLVYTSTEVVGEFALLHTTLRSFGLRGGSALFRLTYRNVPPEELERIKHSIEERMSSRSAAAAAIARSESEATAPTAASVRPSASPSLPSPTASLSAVSKTPARSEPAGRSAANEREQSLDAIARIPGVQVFRPGDPLELTEAERQNAREFATRLGLGALLRETFVPADADTRAASRQPLTNEFANFKFPEATAGQQLYTGYGAQSVDAERTIANELFDEPEFDAACERETIVYSATDGFDERPAIGATSAYGSGAAGAAAAEAAGVAGAEAAATAAEEIPDSFFELSEHDLRQLWTQLQGDSSDASRMRLKSSEAREREREQRSLRYPHATLRLHFPDHTIAQALFLPSETVGSVYKFVKNSIDGSTKFYLYTSPPRTVLTDKRAKLWQCGLVPLTVVYVGFRDFDITSGPSSIKLKPSLLASRSSRRHAELIALRSMPSDVVEHAYHYSQAANLPQAGATNLTRRIQTDTDESEASTWGRSEGHGTSSADRNSDGAPPRSSDGSRLPKWFLRPK